MKTLLAALCVFLAFGIGDNLIAKVSAQAVTYSAGVAREDITPCTPPGLPCGANSILIEKNDRGDTLSTMGASGGSNASLSGVLFPLSVTALAIADSSGNRFVLITLDATSIDSAFTQDVRAALASSRDLPASSILINISHTHSAPSLSWFYGLRQNTQAPNSRYIEAVKRRAVFAAERALDALAPATLSFISGKTSIASWRRDDNETGRASGNALALPLDILIVRPAGVTVPLAIAFLTACHTTATWNLPLASADFAGAAREQLEATFPSAKALFVQGYGGDLNPLTYEVSKFQGANADMPRITGQQLAGDVAALVNAGGTELRGALRAKSYSFSLPIDPELPIAWAGNKRLNYGVRDLPVEVQVLQVGADLSASTSWALVASAHEVVSEYEPLVREALPNIRNLSLAGYSNAVESYIPTKRMVVHDNKQGYGCAGYEGCDSFLSYYLGAPTWEDRNFVDGIVAAVDSRPPTRTVPLTYAFVDPFEGASKNARWSDFVMTSPQDTCVFRSAIRVEQRDHALEIAPLTSATGWLYGGRVLQRPINFTARRASIEVVQGPNAQSNAELVFSISANGGNHYRFSIQHGALRADEGHNTLRPHAATYAKEQDSTWTNVGAFDASRRFLSIRHDASTDEIVWEVSADARSWVVLRRAPRRMSLQSMRIELFAGTWQPEATPGIVRLDNLRVQ